MLWWSVELGWLGILVGWFAMSFILLAAGHAGLGARVFGKRPNGQIPVWSNLLHLPFRLFSSVVWMTTIALGRENAIDRVSDWLLVGRRLRAGEMPSGIDYVVDLTAEMEEYRGFIGNRAANAEDRSPPTWTDQLRIAGPSRQRESC